MRLAQKHGVLLRQSYVRVGKIALIRHQRYAHAKQFKRAARVLRSYSLHAPEVECIGKGKAHKPYEFGVKVSVATPLHRCRGGQFVAHVKALPGNPYDGHTLAAVIPAIESTIGAALDRIVTDAGYKGHNAPKDRRFKVYVAGQRRGLTAAIKRAFRRRSAVEPTIGHLKNEHRTARDRRLQLRPPPQVARSFAPHRPGRPRSVEPLEPDHGSVLIRATSRETNYGMPT